MLITMAIVADCVYRIGIFGWFSIHLRFEPCRLTAAWPFFSNFDWPSFLKETGSASTARIRILSMGRRPRTIQLCSRCQSFVNWLLMKQRTVRYSTWPPVHGDQRTFLQFRKRNIFIKHQLATKLPVKKLSRIPRCLSLKNQSWWWSIIPAIAS